MSEIPAPIACATVGAIIGSIMGSCVQLIPVAIGAGIGCGIGSICCYVNNLTITENDKIAEVIVDNLVNIRPIPMGNEKNDATEDPS